MEKEFISYEQALALKELRFREDVLAWYDTENKLLNTGSLWQLFKNDDDVVLAPLKQQVFRWFREKYELIGLIEIGTQEFNYDIYDNIKDRSVLGTARLSYNEIYEEAENACIDKLIEICKQQNND